MAIHENGYIRGQIGNIVNRKVGNKNILQTRPSHKKKQTGKAKATATDFGTASAAAALIRKAFIETHQELHDSRMHNRLVQQVLRVMRGLGKENTGQQQVKNGHIKRFEHFQFNENCHIHDYIYFEPLITKDKSGRIRIDIPEFERHCNLYLLSNATNISLIFDVVGFDFSKNYFTPLGSAEIDLPLYGKEKIKEEPKQFEFEQEDGTYDVVMVTLAIHYLSVHRNKVYLLNSKLINPVAILAAF